MSKDIQLSNEALKEIFALFSSPGKYEYEQIYKESKRLYYLKGNLNEEYSLTEEKKEYALDAWRAVILFLYRHGYQLKKGDQVIDLSFIEKELIG